MIEVNVWWIDGSDYKRYEFTCEQYARDYIAQVPAALGLEWSLWLVTSGGCMCLDNAVSAE